MRRRASSRSVLAKFPVLSGLALLLQIAAPASAATIVLDDDRSLMVDSFYSCGITSCSVSLTKSATHDGVSPTFSTGRAGISSQVSQHSSIGAGGLFGTGLTASGPAIDILEIDAESVLSITFELTEDTPYYLSGSVVVSEAEFARDPLSSATVLLSDAGGTLHGFSVNTTSGPQGQSFSEQGVLAAGVYTLFAQALQGPNADGTTSEFVVQLALPEPGIALLLGGLLLFAARFRR